MRNLKQIIRQLTQMKTVLAVTACVVMIGVVVGIEVENELQYEQLRKEYLTAHIFGGKSPTMTFIDNTLQSVAFGLEQSLPPETIDKFRGKICCPW